MTYEQAIEKLVKQLRGIFEPLQPVEVWGVWDKTFTNYNLDIVRIVVGTCGLSLIGREDGGPCHFTSNVTGGAYGLSSVMNTVTEEKHGDLTEEKLAGIVFSLVDRQTQAEMVKIVEETFINHLIMVHGTIPNEERWGFHWIARDVEFQVVQNMNKDILLTMSMLGWSVDEHLIPVCRFSLTEFALWANDMAGKLKPA